jgi:hypothetical protein
MTTHNSALGKDAAAEQSVRIEPGILSENIKSTEDLQALNSALALLFSQLREARRQFECHGVHCVTVLGWQDPRGLDENNEPLVAVLPSGERVPRDAEAANELDRRDGTLMWPERFGPTEIARIKAELGPYLASGRLQQSPMPAKGGIFQRDWWQLYEDPQTNFRRSTISLPRWTARSLKRSRMTRAH